MHRHHATTLEPRDQLRINRETVRELRLRTGVRTGGSGQSNTTTLAEQQVQAAARQP